MVWFPGGIERRCIVCTSRSPARDIGSLIDLCWIRDKGRGIVDTARTPARRDKRTRANRVATHEIKAGNTQDSVVRAGVERLIRGTIGSRPIAA